MICPNCGTECKSGVFCRICGERLPAVNPPENAAAPEPAPAPEPVPVFEPVPVSVPEPAPEPAARTLSLLYRYGWIGAVVPLPLLCIGGRRKRVCAAS